MTRHKLKTRKSRSHKLKTRKSRSHKLKTRKSRSHKLKIPKSLKEKAKKLGIRLTTGPKRRIPKSEKVLKMQIENAKKKRKGMKRKYRMEHPWRPVTAQEKYEEYVVDRIYFGGTLLGADEQNRTTKGKLYSLMSLKMDKDFKTEGGKKYLEEYIKLLLSFLEMSEDKYYNNIFKKDKKRIAQVEEDRKRKLKEEEEEDRKRKLKEEEDRKRKLKEEEDRKRKLKDRKRKLTEEQDRKIKKFKRKLKEEQDRKSIKRKSKRRISKKRSKRKSKITKTKKDR